MPKEETIFHSNIKNWWIFPFRRFDSPRKIYKFFHEVSNMLTQKENIAKFFTIFSKILFHSSSNDPIFPKEKSQFQFLRQRTQVQFDPLFKKKKKKLSFLLGRTIEDHPSRFYPNLSSRTTINNIIFNKATTSSRIRFICDKISSSPPNWNLINILIRDEVNRSRQNFPPKEIGTRGWFLPPVGVQRCITTSLLPFPLPIYKIYQHFRLITSRPTTICEEIER